ncbi:hypothetical protein M8494_35995 [Serratia ureilytica]
MTTTGCFSRIRRRLRAPTQTASSSAACGGVCRGPSGRHQNPLLCGAIPFDTRLRRCLFHQQGRWFDRAALAGVRPAANALNWPA